jgi:hypothetical protein
MAELPSELRTLVQRYGTRVLDDADGLRATLDDFLDEDANPGDVNLLVDAVRFGSLERLRTLLNQGAEPAAAMLDVAAGLAQRRGGDAESAYWACSVLGYAADLLRADLVPASSARPSSLFPTAHPVTGVTAPPPSGPGADTTNTTDEDHVRSSTDDNNQADWLTKGGLPAGSSAAEGTVAPPEQSPPTHGSESEAGDSSAGSAKGRARRRGALAVAAAVVLLAVGGIVRWQLQDPQQPVSLEDVVPGMNAAMESQNHLPLDKCAIKSRDHFQCDHPYDGVNTVELTTYTSLHELYDAYKEQVKELADRDVTAFQNHGDCNKVSTGERSWNHDKRHPDSYTVAQVGSDDFPNEKAEGRVFCTLQDGIFRLVWTDNTIKMLGFMSGDPQRAAYTWWHDAHHHFDVGASDNMTDEEMH